MTLLQSLLNPGSRAVRHAQLEHYLIRQCLDNGKPEAAVPLAFVFIEARRTDRWDTLDIKARPMVLNGERDPVAVVLQRDPEVPFLRLRVTRDVGTQLTDKYFYIVNVL